MLDTELQLGWVFIGNSVSSPFAPKMGFAVSVVRVSV